jgi:hypothetical protein
MGIISYFEASSKNIINLFIQRIKELQSIRQMGIQMALIVTTIPFLFFTEFFSYLNTKELKYKKIKFRIINKTH